MKLALYLLLSCVMSFPLIAGDLTSYGIAYPEFDSKQKRQQSLDLLSQLNLHQIRLSTNWVENEPKSGKFNFKKLDEQLSFAKSNGLQVMLTVDGAAPTWACRNAQCSRFASSAFRKYISQLMTRYGDHIESIQFANAWDYYGWRDAESKTIVKLTNIMYEVVKALSPDTTVVIGGISRIWPASQQFCEQASAFDEYKMPPSLSVDVNRQSHMYDICVLAPIVDTRVREVLREAQYDSMDLHLYGNCNNWQQDIEWVKKQTNKPVMVSEFAINEQNRAQQTEMLETCLPIIADLPISKLFYYGFSDNKRLNHYQGFLDHNQRAKASFAVYRSYLNRQLP